MICKTCKRELHQDWVCCPWCSTKNKAEAGTDKTRVYRFYAEQLKQSWGELAPNTVRGYQSPFRRCVDHFGDLPVAGITPAMIKAFLDSLGKTFCKKTVITHRQLISQTMALAILGGDITFNPTDAKYRTAGRPSAQREEAPAKDQKIISEAWNEDMYSRLGFLIKCTGLRKGEALALQFKDIDNARHILHVSKSVYFTGNTPHIKEPKTKAGIRRVVMLDSLSGKFVGNPNDYVFSFDGKTLLRCHQVEKGWQAFCVRHGMAQPRKGHGYVQCSTTFHQLRHSFATNCKEAGIDPRVIQEMMGHSSYAVTDSYTHIRQSMLDEARSRLNEIDRAFWAQQKIQP